ncbi:MAG: hypothetical protein MR779_00590 [Tenericutes bacterium]|nr:hypothetical protein [Mycoplasmatota bacterium]
MYTEYKYLTENRKRLYNNLDRRSIVKENITEEELLLHNKLEMIEEKLAKLGKSSFEEMSYIKYAKLALIFSSALSVFWTFNLVIWSSLLSVLYLSFPLLSVVISAIAIDDSKSEIKRNEIYTKTLLKEKDDIKTKINEKKNETAKTEPKELTNKLVSLEEKNIKIKLDLLVQLSNEYHNEIYRGSDKKLTRKL